MNEPVVVDNNLISSRTPKDLAPFARAVVEFLNACGYRAFEYLWFLQLLASLNFAATISFPQILPPARRGVARKSSFRSAKYLSIAVIACSTD